MLLIAMRRSSFPLPSSLSSCSDCLLSLSLSDRKAWKLEFEASATVGFKLAFNYLKCEMFVEAIDICEKVSFLLIFSLLFSSLPFSLPVCSQVLALYPDYPRIRPEILQKAQASLRP
jgi:tetratricopeptide repeat protein 21B